MRLRLVAILSLVFAVGCGGQPQGIVIFKGSTPRTALEKDDRSAISQCGACGREVTLGEKCGNPKCKANLQWPKEFPCPGCNGTGNCKACEQLDQKEGRCFKCKGEGYITFQGKNPDCPSCRPRAPKCPGCEAKPAEGHKTSCKLKGKCQTCGGTAKCDLCQGTQKISRDQVAKLIEKGKNKGEEPQTPPDAGK